MLILYVFAIWNEWANSTSVLYNLLFTLNSIQFTTEKRQNFKKISIFKSCHLSHFLKHHEALSFTCKSEVNIRISDIRTSYYMINEYNKKKCTWTLSEIAMKTPRFYSLYLIIFSNQTINIFWKNNPTNLPLRCVLHFRLTLRLCSTSKDRLCWLLICVQICPGEKLNSFISSFPLQFLYTFIT